MMNPANILKMRSAMTKFQSAHPKFVSFLSYVFRGGMPEGTIIEITVTKPGEEPITSNLKVTQEDLELFDSLKDLG